MSTLAWLAWLPAALTAVLTAHTMLNARLLRHPDPTPPPPPVDLGPSSFQVGQFAAITPRSTTDSAEVVAVLLPVRDEAARVGACLTALLAQRGVGRLSVLVLDDGSSDGTGDLARRVIGGDPRARVIDGGPLPPGWLGKPYACQQLADATDPDTTVLVFVDADVTLHPDAVAAAVASLRQARVALLSPYPLILAETVGERIVQPLLQWSWLTFLPLRAMERSPRTSLAAAGGQYLVVDAAGYRAAGGHAAVRDRVLEDIALARAVKRSGGRIALVDGSRLASCRMYRSWSELTAGYEKSLWASFGSPAGAAAVVVLLLLGYGVPPLLALAGLLAALVGVPGAAIVGAGGLVAYLLGVAGRVVSARATGGRAWPDALAHPASVAVFGWLVVRSYRLRRAGTLRWRGRPVVP